MPPHTALFSFPRDAELARLLYCLGPDYPAGLADSLETGFNRQQPGTRLAALRCQARPQIISREEQAGRLTQVEARFELEAFLGSPAAGDWRLDLEVCLTGTGLDGADGGKVHTEVEVRASGHWVPSGKLLLEDLGVGLWLEMRLERLEWGALLEELMLLSDPEVEQSGETCFLSWPDEAIFEGLRGRLLASFPPDRPTLQYITLTPPQPVCAGPVEDALLPEWWHLVHLFGLHSEMIPQGGFRWSLGELELDLLARPLGDPYPAGSVSKFLAVHCLRETPA